MLYQPLAGDGGFDELLAELSAARLADEEMRRRESSLAERAEARDRLMRLRAALAEARRQRSAPPMSVDGTRDLRVSRGIILE